MSSLRHQVSGQHYKRYKIQPVEYAHANGLGFMEANVVKYVTRHRGKGGANDLRKAIHFLEMLLELEYRVEPTAEVNPPAPETEVPAEWEEARKETRRGTPNSAFSAVIAPTISQPGFLDKCAEALPGLEVQFCGWCGGQKPATGNAGCDKCNPVWLRQGAE